MEPTRTHARDTVAWLVGDLAGLEGTRAVLVRHAFGRHLHDGLVVSIVDGGAGTFWCEGRIYQCRAGSVVLIGPGEVHTGRALPGSVLRYRTVSIGRELLDSLWPDWAARVAIRDHAPRDRELASAVRRLATDLVRPAGPRECESRPLGLLDRIATRHATERHPTDRREPAAIAAAKAYLDAHERDNVSLRELALTVGLHPAYLNRIFSRSVGLPPHAYQVQRRLQRSRALLARGVPASAAARAVGFYDQSHFGRHFRRAFGMPPGGVRARV